MSTTKEESQRLTKFWRSHVEQWSGSGLSQHAYCRENNLKPNQFTYWKIKFKKQNLSPEIVQVPAVQIANLVNPSVQRGLRLNIDTGFQIEIPDGFSQNTLSSVLKVLGKI